MCYKYDWKYIDEQTDIDGGLLLLEVVKDKEYFRIHEWSAYNFLYLNGPSPFSIFISCKFLKLESIYSIEKLEKFKKYGLI